MSIFTFRLSEHLALPSSSRKGQESSPLFPLKYTLSQFLRQMGTHDDYQRHSKNEYKGSLLYRLSLSAWLARKEAEDLTWGGAIHTTNRSQRSEGMKVAEGGPIASNIMDV